MLPKCRTKQICLKQHVKSQHRISKAGRGLCYKRYCHKSLITTGLLGQTEKWILCRRCTSVTRHVELLDWAIDTLLMKMCSRQCMMARSGEGG